MIYEFNCEACNENFEVSLPMADNQKPLSEPCILCGVKGKVFRVFQSSQHIHDMVNTKEKLAGSGWNDVLNSIHKASDSTSTAGHHSYN